MARDDQPPQNMSLSQWQAENCAISSAKIQIHAGADADQERLASYLFRAIYWDLRGRDPFDLTKAGPTRDGLRDRASSIADQALRELLRDFAARNKGDA